MNSLRIVALSVLAAVLYGIIHDQITVRVCLEYFTIGHPPVFSTHNPTLLALGWGIIATWWVGLPLGVLLALASQIGSWPKLYASQLLKPILILCLVMGVSALASGITGDYLARSHKIFFDNFVFNIPDQARTGFIADWWAHGASYASGVLGGLVLVTWTVLRRRSLSLRGGTNAGSKSTPVSN